MKKPNGTANLYRRDNFWWVKIRVDGKPIYRSTKCQKIEEARKFRDQLIGQKARGELTRGRRDQVLIRELLDDVLVSDIADSTRKNWRLVTNAHLLPFFGHIRASHLTTNHLEEYRAKRLGQGVSDATCNRELCVLRTAVNNARKRGKVFGVPYFAMRAETTVRTGFLLDGDYAKVRDSITCLTVRLAFVVAYHCGLRKGELLQIKWNQVDLVSGFIDLTPETTKTREGRRIPILRGDMMDLLVEAKRLRDEEWPTCQSVFNRNGKRVIDFRTVWQNAVAAAGVPGLHFHDLRRTAARNMRNDGIPQAIAMKITGHRTDAMYRRYAIISDDDLAIAKRLMEEKRNRIVTAPRCSGIPGNTDEVSNPQKST